MAKLPQAKTPFKESSGNARTAKTTTGRGSFAPGFALIGTGKGKATNRVAQVKIVKRVSKLDGQGAAKVGAGGRYAHMNSKVVSARVKRVPTVARANTGSSVVRPPKTAVRISGRGAGVVRTV